MKHATAFSIQGEVLAEGLTCENLETQFREGSHSDGVLFQTIAQALIGSVKYGNMVLGLQTLADCPPLLKCRVYAGRVVTAALHGENAAIGSAFDDGKNAFKVNIPPCGIKIRIFLGFEANRMEDSCCNAPGWSADINPWLWLDGRGDQQGSDMVGSRARYGLN